MGFRLYGLGLGYSLDLGIRVYGLNVIGVPGFSGYLRVYVFGPGVFGVAGQVFLTIPLGV